MIFTASAPNLQELFFKSLIGLRDQATVVQVGYKNAGGSETRELSPAVLELEHPMKRTLLYPRRGNNPFATLAETMWVLAGRSDVAWLEKFLPRAKDFSDDGICWRAGYGPRLRNWHTERNQDVDQIEFVLKQLTNNIQSRQAIISLWNPALECVVDKTKDFPCSNWVHFMIRDGRLNCTVVMRSNDVVWGWSSINVYEFTVLQEVIAGCLGIPVGKYTHLSDSFHIYDKYYEKMGEFIDSYVDLAILKYLPTFSFFCDKDIPHNLTPQETYKEYIADVDEMVKNVDVFNHSRRFEPLNQIHDVLCCYHRNEWKEFEDNVWPILPFSDLKVALYYWYKKNILKEKEGGLPMIQDCIIKAREVKYTS